MNKSILSLFTILITVCIGYAQKPVAERALALFNGRSIDAYSLFNPASESKRDFDAYLKTSYSLTLRKTALRELHDDNPGLIKLELPSPFNITLDLYQANVFSGSAQIHTSDGRSFTPDQDRHFYRGIIHDQPNSLAIVTLSSDRIQIVWSDESGNKRIQQSEGVQYLAFADKDLLIPKQLDCYTDDSKATGVDDDHTPN
ncbi:MAG TPA: hypothetical protein VMZ69_09705, partial [Saprospiraceae bacterium]|nr:hypothetical protein [Saprospiraceae bacterium]